MPANLALLTLSITLLQDTEAFVGVAINGGVFVNTANQAKSNAITTRAGKAGDLVPAVVLGTAKAKLTSTAVSRGDALIFDAAGQLGKSTTTTNPRAIALEDGAAGAIIEALLV